AEAVIAAELDQHADTAAVHIAGQLVLGGNPGKAADADVFADLADQCRAGGFNRAFTEGQRGERVQVGRVGVGNQLGQLVGEADEIFVLGDEVGFAVDFDRGTQLGVGRHVHGDQAISGDTAGGL